MSTSVVIHPQRPRVGAKRFFAVLGPGLVVMLADTDVGSIITAGQSGAQWGYRLLLLQIVLMPILCVVQELTVRLGIFTGKGHGELIRDMFGKHSAWLSVTGLGVASIGALLTEFSGVAGVGELFGVPRWCAARPWPLSGSGLSARGRVDRFLSPSRNRCHRSRAFRMRVFLDRLFEPPPNRRTRAGFGAVPARQ
jgi:Natural resistance-associated macrophage protein